MSAIVKLKISAELVRDWLQLGDRRIIGAWMVEGPTIVFEVEADDAPDGATEMDPAYRQEWEPIPGFKVTMTDPGWIVPPGGRLSKERTEPALGPAFREQLAAARADAERMRRERDEERNRVCEEIAKIIEADPSSTSHSRRRHARLARRYAITSEPEPTPPAIQGLDEPAYFCHPAAVDTYETQEGTE
jgi:hypothetical protein